MNRIRKSALAALAVTMLVSAIAFAQGPIQKRINYSINVQYSLQMGEYTLSPGQYVLYQVSATDPNIFGLFPNDLTHSPVAMIHTTRISYVNGRYPQKTKIMLDVDESGNVAQPVLRGWTIPGEDGWEIISVVAKDSRYLTHVK